MCFHARGCISHIHWHAGNPQQVHESLMNGWNCHLVRDVARIRSGSCTPNYTRLDNSIYSSFRGLMAELTCHTKALSSSPSTGVGVPVGCTGLHRRILAPRAEGPRFARGALSPIRAGRTVCNKHMTEQCPEGQHGRTAEVHTDRRC